MSGQAAEPECWCEYVDIGVGMQKVAENPECPRCTQGLPPGGVTFAELAAQNRRLAALVEAATEFTFLPDLEDIGRVDPSEYAVRLGKGKEGRWYLTRGDAARYGTPWYAFWDCAKQRFKSSMGISTADSVFYGFDGPIEDILELHLPAALAAQTARARQHSEARR